MKKPTKPKYANYTELAAAMMSGELDCHYYIMLDKGGTEAMLNWHDPKASDEENDKRQNECASLFNPDFPDGHIMELFDALRIPAKWC